MFGSEDDGSPHFPRWRELRLSGRLEPVEHKHAAIPCQMVRSVKIRVQPHGLHIERSRLVVGSGNRVTC